MYLRTIATEQYEKYGISQESPGGSHFNLS